MIKLTYKIKTGHYNSGSFYLARNDKMDAYDYADAINCSVHDIEKSAISEINKIASTLNLQQWLEINHKEITS